MPTILIVDDEESIRNSLAAIFDLYGYQTKTAKDGRDALAQFWDDQPDLVVLDAMMPNLNGYEVCEILKEDPDSRRTPILMLTARRREQDRGLSYALGADRYMSKPFRLQELLDCVEDLLTAKEPV